MRLQERKSHVIRKGKVNIMNILDKRIVDIMGFWEEKEIILDVESW